jgi:hypothetical protein
LLRRGEHEVRFVHLVGKDLQDMIDRSGIDDVSRHDEWLVDEAIRDSFPASDPPSIAQPGSIVNRRYARGETTDVVRTWKAR